MDASDVVLVLSAGVAGSFRPEDAGGTTCNFRKTFESVCTQLACFYHYYHLVAVGHDSVAHGMHVVWHSGGTRDVKR